jgi:hypothetical protein
MTVLFGTLPRFEFESTWLMPFEQANARSGEMFVVEELAEDVDRPIEHLRTFRVQRRAL